MLYKRLLVSALALAVVPTMVYGIMHRPGMVHAAAQNLTGTGFCVAGTSHCLDLKGDTFTIDNPIVFYGWDSTEDRFRWNRVFVANVTYSSSGDTSKDKPFRYAPLDQQYQGKPYYLIEKTTSSGHNGCAGYSSAKQNVAWEPCSDNGLYSPYFGASLWVLTNGYYVNVKKSDVDPEFLPNLMSEVNDGQNGCLDGDGNNVMVSPNFCQVQFQVGAPA
jgi:hypothetical protein